MIPTRTMGRVLRGLLGVLALVALGAAVALGLRCEPRGLLTTKVDLNAALTALRNEELAFLVTDRVVTQVVVERREHSFLLGEGEGYIIGLVRFHYGVNLVSLSEEAIQRDGDSLLVTVPEPRELDFSVDLRTLRYITKRSGLLAIRDWVTGANTRRELREAFHEAAQGFVRKEGLAPTREALVHRLNRYAPVLKARLGVAVRFR